MEEIAHAEALDILHNHQPPPLPRGAWEEIEDILVQAGEVLTPERSQERQR
jgi:hypothetical protein